MNIVVLDGYAANPGDLSWSALETLGSGLRVFERTPPELVVERALEAEVVLTNKVVLSGDVIEALPRLRYIGVLATGCNVVDLEAARRRQIPVTNVPGYSTASVAQMVFALLLEMVLQVGHHSRRVHEGAWSRSPDFCFWEKPLIELEGLCLGILGYGAIGRRVAAIGRAFGMKVRVHTRTPVCEEGVEHVDLESLFAQSDVVSLHCPLTDQTRRIVNAQRLASMKNSAYLINTGRGPLVDEKALAEALAAGVIAGAALDVLSVEPSAQDNPLIGAPNCILTPHVAWATGAARKRLLEVAVANVRAFLSGAPCNVVN